MLFSGLFFIFVPLKKQEYGLTGKSNGANESSHESKG